MENNFFATNLKYLRTKRGLEQKDISDFLGLKSATSVTNWEKGTNLARAGHLSDLASFFNISLHDLVKTDLTTSENTTLDKIIEISTKLSEPRQHNVYTYAEEQLEEQNNIVEEPPMNVYELFPIRVTEALAAGTGYAYGDNNTETFYTDRDDLKGYDFASLVNGDSMEPFYPDGTVVLIKSGYDNDRGAIYAIDYDGKSYLKKLFDEPDHVRLVSINTKYDDIIINKPFDAYFNIIGKVVDSFTPVKR